MTETPTKTLLEEIDETALALLAKVRQDDKVEKTELFIEQVKAFEAVAKWAQTRQIVAPPPPPDKKESKFERTKRAFNGEADGRRRAPRRDKSNGIDVAGVGAAAGTPVDLTEPADGDDEVSIEDL